MTTVIVKAATGVKRDEPVDAAAVVRMLTTHERELIVTDGRLRALNMHRAELFAVEVPSADPPCVVAVLRAEWMKQADDLEKDLLRQRDTLAWIGAHGSERLRKSVEGGYDCHGAYREERCAKEMPGWRPKRQREKLLKRANPTLAELEAADACGATVMWCGTGDGYTKSRAVLVVEKPWATLIMDAPCGPACGHSACSQNYIDTGDVRCISAEKAKGKIQ